MLELSGIEHKATIITMLQEVKVNTFEMNGKIEILNRLIQTVKKNQVEILELNDTTSLKNSLGGISNKMEMTEETVSESENRSMKIKKEKQLLKITRR